MSSDFNIIRFDELEGEKVSLNRNDSSRYEIYKVRIMGVLHFVKKIKRNTNNDLISIEALRKEFMIAYPLNHPGVVRYTHFDGEALFEEFIDGLTLRQMIDSGDERLHDKELIADICKQLLDSLEYIHGQGVIHLDLKPENVMITRIGNHVKIIDFGCASSATCDSTPGHTPGYMAPEQIYGATNAYTDIFLLGKIMDEITEYSGDKRRWRKFLRKALAENPNERFKSEKEAIEEIPYRKSGKTNGLYIGIIVSAIGILCALIVYFERVGNREGLSADNVPTKTDTVYIVSKPDTVRIITESPIAEPLDRNTPRENFETTLRKQIEREIYSYFDQYIEPYLAYPRENQSEFMEAMNRNYNRMVQYRSQMVEKYPQYRALIEKECTATYDARASSTLIKFFPPIE